MKFIRLFSHYRRGIRLYSFLMAVLMTWAMLWGVSVYGRVQYLTADLDIISSADVENAYYLCYFPTKEEFMEGKDMEYAAYTERALESDSSIETVFSIQVVTAVYIGEARVSLTLYEPEMIAFFPGLKKLGMDFSENPNGIILAGQLSAPAGEEVVLRVSGKKAAFSVAGQLQAPYRRMTFSVSATNPYAGDLFSDGEAVLMQRTDAVMEKLQTLTNRANYDTNLMVVFDETTTPEQQKALLKEKAAGYMAFPLAELVKNSKNQVADTLKQELPQPLFLAISATVAYLSIAVLTFQKKQQTLAQLYLCGASHRKCAAVVFSAFQMFAVVPILLNVLFIFLWPRIDWNALSPASLIISDPEITAWALEHQEILGVISRLHRLISTSIVVRPDCLWVVFWYYILTMLVSLGTTVGVMRKYTPHTFLKGVSQ